MTTPEIALALTRMRVKHVLIEAALTGHIPALACAMPECACPQGREHFEPTRSAWAPSCDRYPLAGRNGGEYVIDNVRVAHVFCNQADGGRNHRPAPWTAERRAAQAERLRVLRLERGSEMAKAAWGAKTAKERSAIRRAQWTPEMREAHAARMRAQWTPERRAAHSAKIKAVRARQAAA